MTLDSFARHGLTLLLDASLKSLVVLALVGVALLFGRRASASARHLCLLLGLIGFLALPILTLALPGWRVSLWPQTATVLPSAPAIESPPTGHVPQFMPSTPEEAGPVTAPPSSSSPDVTPVAPKAPARRALPPWPTTLFLLWIVAAVLTLAPTLAGLVAVRRLARRCRRLAEGPLVALATALRCEVGVGRPVTLLQGEPAESAAVPMTWGWRRPTILLPAGAEDWPPERLRVVLLHELAHIKRGDWPCQMLAHAVCAIYWFHPGAWLLARQLRIESERACDDFVISAGVLPDDYARHLLDVVRLIRTAKGTLKTVLPMAQVPRIEGRLRAVLAAGLRRRPPSRAARAAAHTLATGVLVILGAARPHALPPPPPARPLASSQPAWRPRTSLRARPARMAARRPPALPAVPPATQKGVPVMKNLLPTSKRALPVALTALASLAAHAAPSVKAKPTAGPTVSVAKAPAAPAARPAPSAGVPPAVPHEAQAPRPTLRVTGDASRLTVSASQAPVADVLSRLFKQSGRNFSLAADVAGTITLSLLGTSPDDALNAVLAASAQPLVYEIRNGTYFVHIRSAAAGAATPDAIFHLYSLPLKNVNPQYVLDALRKSDEWRTLLPARNSAAWTHDTTPRPTASQFEGVRSVIPSERDNSLVIRATEDGFGALQAVVRLLDKPAKGNVAPAK